MSQIVYTGESLRKYFSRRGITYIEASEFLGLDKNTIGKAVRGGNLNMSVLLTICNRYHLDITEFFVLENPDGTTSPLHSPSANVTAFFQDESSMPAIAAEDSSEYNIEKKEFQYEDYLAAKDQEISLLREMNELYKRQIAALQEQLFDYERRR